MGMKYINKLTLSFSAESVDAISFTSSGLSSLTENFEHVLGSSSASKKYSMNVRNAR
jgi:hypothetical protein